MEMHSKHFIIFNINAGNVIKYLLRYIYLTYYTNRVKIILCYNGLIKKRIFRIGRTHNK